MRPDYPLRTARLVLRPFAPEDLDDVRAFQSRADVARYLYWEPRDRDEVREVLAAKASRPALEDEGQSLALAVVLPETGRVIGEVDLRWLSREHRQGEIGFVLHPDHQGRGLAAEAAAVGLRLGFEGLGLHRIQGRCDARNLASARLMERLGMRREARLVHNEVFKGEFGDELVYAMLEDEWRGAPAFDVAIREADAAWPAEFARWAGELRGVLGDLAARIDHIGSTSVPGLAAKDVVDVQVTVADEAAMTAAAGRLAEAGWPVRPPGMRDHVVPGEPADAREWTKRFSREPPGSRRVNVHVRVAGRANQRYALLFRDYLRAHPEAAAAYGAFKRRAAALLPRDLDAYADLKDPVCDLVYLPAREWAARTDWAPGPAGPARARPGTLR